MCSYSSIIFSQALPIYIMLALCLMLLATMRSYLLCLKLCWHNRLIPIPYSLTSESGLCYITPSSSAQYLITEINLITGYGPKSLNCVFQCSQPLFLTVAFSLYCLLMIVTRFSAVRDNSNDWQSFFPKSIK